VQAEWDALLALRDACLAATEETGRQLWGPARYAAYRIALDGPAPLAAAMLEPGVLRFGLGPLTEVIAQHHTFAELDAHLDATSRPVVAQERVLRGEDLRDVPDVVGPDDPPAVLQPFEPAYTVPEYRADERLDGTFLPRGSATFSPPPVPPVSLATGSAVPTRARAVARVLEDAVAVWEAQSGADVRVSAVAGPPSAVLATLGRTRAEVRASTVPDLLGLVAFAAASGGVHGRRRGGAAGRAQAWWLARTATGLDRTDGVPVDDLEFALEDLELLELRSDASAAWRLELAIGAPGGEWAVAVSALDREDDDASDPAGHHGANGPGARPEEDVR
jgi:hypothetical protein